MGCRLLTHAPSGAATRGTSVDRNDQNLASIWEAIADAVPEAPAVVQGDTVRTWGEF